MKRTTKEKVEGERNRGDRKSKEDMQNNSTERFAFYNYFKGHVICIEIVFK